MTPLVWATSGRGCSSSSGCRAAAGRRRSPPVSRPETRTGADPKAGPGGAGRRSLRSALGRAQGESADELLLQHEEDDERGDGDHDRAGGDEVVVREELALEVVERRR